jgi:hypothetical protein
MHLSSQTQPVQRTIPAHPFARGGNGAAEGERGLAPSEYGVQPSGLLDAFRTLGSLAVPTVSTFGF